ncbi:hypothetical protein ACERK3_18645 [Phycisphaerales bacterium AB-hyl4]|uniref:Acetyl-CoA C-acetyltransferase n=1 Tax=Natronomicrosphaera hydrolytica TaxID=3242702 RepID=A0ABV4UBF7_9BACT
MSRSYITAAARVVDGQGTLQTVHQQWSHLREQGARRIELVIDPLHTGWDTPVQANHFRSGCGPIEALARADELIRAGRADAVLITGEDNLRSQYAHDKPLRQRLMSIYDNCPLPQAYTLLARAFMRLHGIGDVRFMQLAHTLYDNYVRTAQRQGRYKPPPPAAFEMVTDLFRAVDCANPVIDFAGAVIVASDTCLRDDTHRIAVLGVGLGQTRDGPAHVDDIARYDHLARACVTAYEQAGVDLGDAFRRHRALIEVYTCFPVAPLGFLLATGIARDVADIPAVLASYEITVAGGMNIGRAPWNNPALNALVAMCDRLRENAISGVACPRLGAVHGNGGLGYRQGVAMLGVA